MVLLSPERGDRLTHEVFDLLATLRLIFAEHDSENPLLPGDDDRVGMLADELESLSLDVHRFVHPR